MSGHKRSVHFDEEVKDDILLDAKRVALSSSFPSSSSASSSSSSSASSSSSSSSSSTELTVDALSDDVMLYVMSWLTLDDIRRLASCTVEFYDRMQALIVYWKPVTRQYDEQEVVPPLGRLFSSTYRLLSRQGAIDKPLLLAGYDRLYLHALLRHRKQDYSFDNGNKWLMRVLSTGSCATSTETNFTAKTFGSAVYSGVECVIKRALRLGANGSISVPTERHPLRESLQLFFLYAKRAWSNYEYTEIVNSARASIPNIVRLLVMPAQIVPDVPATWLDCLGLLRNFKIGYALIHAVMLDNDIPLDPLFVFIEHSLTRMMTCDVAKDGHAIVSELTTKLDNILYQCVAPLSIERAGLVAAAIMTKFNFMNDKRPVQYSINNIKMPKCYSVLCRELLYMQYIPLDGVRLLRPYEWATKNRVCQLPHLVLFLSNCEERAKIEQRFPVVEARYLRSFLQFLRERVAPSFGWKQQECPRQMIYLLIRERAPLTAMAMASFFGPDASLCKCGTAPVENRYNVLHCFAGTGWYAPNEMFVHDNHAINNEEDELRRSAVLPKLLDQCQDDASIFELRAIAQLFDLYLKSNNGPPDQRALDVFCIPINHRDICRLRAATTPAEAPHLHSFILPPPREHNSDSESDSHSDMEE